MKIKRLPIMKKILSNKLFTNKPNNSKEKNLQYERNKYGFFSAKNKEK
jgi:hypothetical protein